MTRNPDDPRPEYVQIAEDLRSAVRSRRLKVGDKLPARRNLAAEYGVATATVDRAVEELIRDGVLVAWNRGTFVRATEPAQPAPSAEYEAVMRELQAIRDDLQRVESRVAQLEQLSASDAGTS